MKRVYSIFLLALSLLMLVSPNNASAWNYWQNNSGTSSNDNLNLGSGSWNYWSDFNFGNYNPSPSQPSQPQPSEPVQPTQPEDPPAETPGQPTQPTQPINPSQPLQPLPNNVPYPSRSLSSVERELVDLVNQERVAAGLNPLEIDMTLVGLAKDKSHSMATTGEVRHDARSQFHANLDAAGVSYRQAGENLAKAGTINRVHSGLMASSGHRANIMASGYTHIGVGIVRYGNSYYATQIFVRR